MKVSFIIVSWNVKNDLYNCLKSIFNNKLQFPFEIIVIDNASTDGTAPFITANFPEAIFISNNQNRGFAAANNQGIKKATGDLIFLLNPDTILNTGQTEILVNYLTKHPDIGAVGPLLLNIDGTSQNSVRKFPTFKAALHRHTLLKHLRLFKNEYKNWTMKDFDYTKQADVEQLMGAAILIKREVLEKIGPFDERYFMYYEEVDLCYRIWQAGWRIVFLPQAFIVHLGGKSSGQIPFKKKFMAAKSLLQFFCKFRGTVRTIFFAIVFLPLMLIRQFMEFMAQRFKSLFFCDTKSA